MAGNPPVPPHMHPNYRRPPAKPVIEYTVDPDSRRGKRNSRRKTLFKMCNELAIICGGNVFCLFADDNGKHWVFSSDEETWKNFNGKGLRCKKGSQRYDGESKLVSEKITLPTADNESPFPLSFAMDATAIDVDLNVTPSNMNINLLECTTSTPTSAKSPPCPVELENQSPPPTHQQSTQHWPTKYSMGPTQQQSALQPGQQGAAFDQGPSLQDPSYPSQRPVGYTKYLPPQENIIYTQFPPPKQCTSSPNPPQLSVSHPQAQQATLPTSCVPLGPATVPSSQSQPPQHFGAMPSSYQATLPVSHPQAQYGAVPPSHPQAQYGAVPPSHPQAHYRAVPTSHPQAQYGAVPTSHPQAQYGAVPTSALPLQQGIVPSSTQQLIGPTSYSPRPLATEKTLQQASEMTDQCTAHQSVEMTDQPNAHQSVETTDQPNPQQSEETTDQPNAQHNDTELLSKPLIERPVNRLSSSQKQASKGKSVKTFYSKEKHTKVKAKPVAIKTTTPSRKKSMRSTRRRSPKFDELMSRLATSRNRKRRLLI